jgi:hypothetical protein
VSSPTLHRHPINRVRFADANDLDAVEASPSTARTSTTCPGFPVKRAACIALAIRPPAALSKALTRLEQLAPFAPITAAISPLAALTNRMSMNVLYKLKTRDLCADTHKASGSPARVLTAGRIEKRGGAAKALVMATAPA